MARMPHTVRRPAADAEAFCVSVCDTGTVCVEDGVVAGDGVTAGADDAEVAGVTVLEDAGLVVSTGSGVMIPVPGFSIVSVIDPLFRPVSVPELLPGS